MKFKSVSYGFTKNLGNFESERIGAEIDLTEIPEDMTVTQNSVTSKSAKLDVTVELRRKDEQVALEKCKYFVKTNLGIPCDNAGNNAPKPMKKKNTFTEEDFSALL